MSQPNDSGKPGTLARHRAIVKALDTSTLTATERLVILALETWSANKTGESYPSISGIVQRTALARTTVVDALNEATHKGWLEIKVRGSKIGTNLYRVKLPEQPNRWPVNVYKAGKVKPRGRKRRIQRVYNEVAAQHAKEDADLAFVASLGAPANDLVIEASLVVQGYHPLVVEDD